MKIAFIILNYKNFEETEKCISSINGLDIQEKLIVVVDNGSGDGSVEKLKDNHKEDGVEIISLSENCGFSKGNNVGYKFVKENYDADFVIVTNNDVLFPQKDMGTRIKEIYDNSKFMVLGPDVFVRETREHQSPMYLEMPSIDFLKNQLNMYEYYLNKPEKWAKRRKFQIIKNRVYSKYFLIRKFYSTVKHKREIDSKKYYENCCVQGACIIISKDYLKLEDKLFSPEPFLYCEELLLFLKCNKKNYKIVYDPRIVIWHEDSLTIKKISGNAIEKAKFTLPNHIKALEMVIKYINEDNYNET